MLNFFKSFLFPLPLKFKLSILQRLFLLIFALECLLLPLLNLALSLRLVLSALLDDGSIKMS